MCVFSMILCGSYVLVTIVMWFLPAVVLLQLWFCIYVCDYLACYLTIMCIAALWLCCCSCGYVVMLLQLWLCGCNCGYVVAAVERRGARAVPGRVRSQHPVVAHGRVVHRSAGPRSQVSRV